MGTPRYMSPEQARGEKLDGRSDIFSLGAVLYELFTDQHAFPGTSTAEVFAALLDSRPVAVGGRGLGALIRKALAKDRHARYGAMREFAEDLRRLNPHPSNALLAAPAYRHRTFFARHGNKKWYLVAALAVACVLSLWRWEAAPWARTQQDLRIVPLTTFAGSKDYPAFSPDGKRIAFSWNGGIQGSDERQIYIKPVGDGDPVRLTNGRELVFASRRDEADGSLWRLSIAGGAARPISATLRDASHPQISRQGQLAYTVDWVDTNIYLHTARGWRNGASSPFDHPVAIVNSSWIDHSPSFSPDGERIAFVSNRSGTLEIWVSRRDGSGAVRLTSMNAVSTGSPRWSPDGRHIAFDSWASGRSGIYVVDAGGGVPKLLSAEPNGSWLPVWSADGKWIYLSCERSGRREIWKVPATGGDLIQVTFRGAVRALPRLTTKLSTSPSYGRARTAA